MDKKYDELVIKFIDKPDKKTPCLSLMFNIELTDSMLMFHICHLYYEQVKPELIDFKLVLSSIKSTFSFRLKELQNDFISDHYRKVFDNKDEFDECLTIFIKVKKQLTDFLEEQTNKSKL